MGGEGEDAASSSYFPQMNGLRAYGIRLHLGDGGESRSMHYYYYYYYYYYTLTPMRAVSTRARRTARRSHTSSTCSNQNIQRMFGTSIRLFGTSITCFETSNVIYFGTSIKAHTFCAISSPYTRFPLGGSGSVACLCKGLAFARGVRG